MITRKAILITQMTQFQIFVSERKTMNPSQNPSALRSKKIITETLLRLMTEYSYTEITVKHILLESNISRKTFYRNFSSKDDVLNAYIDSILNSYITCIIEQEHFSFLETLDTIFYFCEKNKNFLFILRDNELLHLLLIKLNTLIPTEHQKIVSVNAKSNDSSADHFLTDYVLFFNIGGMWNIVTKWIEQDMRDSIHDIKNTIAFYLSDVKHIDCRQF